MLKTLSNIVEMFVYGSVYLLISMLAIKIAAAGLSAENDRSSPENGKGFPLVAAALVIGIAIVVSTVIR